ncbi:MAG: VWA domain-containing protein [Mariniblastus sp.]
MNDFEVGNWNYIYLLALVAIGFAVTSYGIFVRRRAAKSFASSKIIDRLVPATFAKNLVSGLMVTACLGLMATALLDIRWGKTWQEVPQKGIEVMFALDISRSMLAEDTSPNRLARAKQQISDMIDEMTGDRVGLVVFAGETRQSVPLTTHYDDFKQVLETVGPHTVRRGGSRLGDAITAAADAFISKTNDHKAIVIFTDGEDQESNPVDVAKSLHQEAGVRIFTVGLGDIEKGARVPDDVSRSNGYIKHDGQQVWSKMNGQILSKIATETNGAYIPAGTKRVNMSDVYHGYVANVEQTEFETAKINAYIARYQWFSFPALILLLAEVWFMSRGKRNSILNASSKTGSAVKSNLPSTQPKTKAA